MIYKLLRIVFALLIIFSIESCSKSKDKDSEKITAVDVVKTKGQKPSPGDIISALKDGNKRYVNGKSVYPHADKARIDLANKENQGDYAYATVLSCSDSRVPAELIFDAGIMDLFIVRIAGNVCDGDEIGSIEYGLSHVKTPVLVVLGHTKCGAVTAVTHEVNGNGHELERNIPGLVDNIIPAVKRAMKDHPESKDEAVIPYAIEENVWQSIEDLFMKSASTRTLVKDGKVKVVGAIYDLGTGNIQWLPEWRVSDMLQSVEENPKREKEAMAASGKHNSKKH